MLEAHESLPHYAWNNNKGYGAAAHYDASDSTASPRNTGRKLDLSQHTIERARYTKDRAQRNA